MMTTTTTTSRAVEAPKGLEGYRFLNLTTFRKSGVPVVTTVLFAVANGKIYVWTTRDSGKVKRIHNHGADRAKHSPGSATRPHSSCHSTYPVGHRADRGAEFD